MITRKKLLILWVIVIVAYAAIMVLTSPRFTAPTEVRAAIYADYMAVAEETHCEPGMRQIILVFVDTYGVTEREAVFSIREGLKADRIADPCGRYYP